MEPFQAAAETPSLRAAGSWWTGPLGHGLALAVVAGGLAVGCSRSVTSTEVQYASDFASLGHSAAVVGVLRGNRLDLEVGEKLSKLSPGILGDCPLGFISVLREERPGIFEALAQPVGPDRDERWVPALMPAAQAAFIVLLEVFGNAGSAAGEADSDLDPPLYAQSRRRSRRRSDVQRPPLAPKSPDMEMDVTLFSVQHRRAVARLEVRYSGDSEREAYEQFGAEFDKAFAQLTCGQWDWTAVRAEKKIDSLGLPVPGGRLLPASVAGS